MPLFKQIGSLFLLLVYSVGIVHGAIPHMHYANELNIPVYEHGMEHGNHHQHHFHDADYSGDHTHVQHEGHFDNGIMDMLICILSESDHTDVAELFLCSRANELSLDEAKLQLAAVLVSFVPTNLEETSSKTIAYTPWVDGPYNCSHISAASRRGPPSVS
ncbi:MAG: hypothetical protein GC178_01700 [Flavobacteriales bacterium]|nr:hypothetical protein [Flavobacteriales bacterium]